MPTSKAKSSDRRDHRLTPVKFTYEPSAPKKIRSRFAECNSADSRNPFQYTQVPLVCTFVPQKCAESSGQPAPCPVNRGHSFAPSDHAIPRRFHREFPTNNLPREPGSTLSRRKFLCKRRHCYSPPCRLLHILKRKRLYGSHGLDRRLQGIFVPHWIHLG